MSFTNFNLLQDIKNRYANYHLKPSEHKMVLEALAEMAGTESNPSNTIDGLHSTLDTVVKTYRNIYDSPLEKPLYIWDGAYTPIAKGEDPETRVEFGGGAVHNETYWRGKYDNYHAFFDSGGIQTTDGEPNLSSQHVKITLPVEAGKNHSIMLLSRNYRYSSKNVWICDSDGNPAAKLEGDCNQGYNSTARPTSTFNPHGGHGGQAGQYWEWLNFFLRHDLVDAYSVSGEVTIVITCASYSNSTQFFVAGIAIAVNKWGLITHGFQALHNAFNGGTGLTGAGQSDYEGYTYLDQSTRYNDVRVNIADPTKSVLVGLVNRNHIYDEGYAILEIGDEVIYDSGTLGKYALNIVGRQEARYPHCYVIPADVVAANYIETDGMYQLPISLYNPNETIDE